MKYDPSNVRITITDKETGRETVLFEGDIRIDSFDYKKRRVSARRSRDSKVAVDDRRLTRKK